MTDPTDSLIRYLVFAGPNYYPSGGMDDLIFETDDLEAAMKAANDYRDDWAHVWDVVTRRKVYEI